MLMSPGCEVKWLIQISRIKIDTRLGAWENFYQNTNNKKSEAIYPSEVKDNLKRIREWDNAKAGGRIQPRARTKEQHKTLLRFKYWCEDNGLDICHMIISHVQADMEAFDAKRSVDLKKSEIGTIIINQQNTFISQVQRPRRLNDSLLGISKQYASNTTSNINRIVNCTIDS